jgi:hypothetical protein
MKYMPIKSENKFEICKLIMIDQEKSQYFPCIKTNWNDQSHWKNKWEAGGYRETLKNHGSPNIAKIKQKIAYASGQNANTNGIKPEKVGNENKNELIGQIGYGI